MRKMYKCGFYGGKFLPFHKGHKYCIQVAAEECERLVVIFFANSEEEEEILKDRSLRDRKSLEKENRRKRVQEECSKYPNVEFAILDCRDMHRQAKLAGTDLWDSETEYVLKTVGDFQAVYSSEPGYDAYFRKAYPWAQHRLVDPPRVHVPISGTKLREMTEEKSKKWL